MKFKLEESAYLKIKEAAARTGHKSHVDWMISILNAKAKEVLSGR
jgi:uncharacterized protein (DUF1778 family)